VVVVVEEDGSDGDVGDDGGGGLLDRWVEDRKVVDLVGVVVVVVVVVDVDGTEVDSVMVLVVVAVFVRLPSIPPPPMVGDDPPRIRAPASIANGGGDDMEDPFLYRNGAIDGEGIGIRGDDDTDEEEEEEEDG